MRTPIVWAGVVSSSSPLRLTVTSLEASGPPRPFSITIESRRPATAADSSRITAIAAIERAEALEREGSSQTANALATYEEAVVRWREAGDSRGEALALAEVGRLQSDQGRSKEATQSFTAAIGICRTIADLACEGIGSHRLGRLYAVAGQPQQGFDTLQQALELRKRLGDAAGQAETLMELGGLDATRSQNTRAEEWLGQSIALAHSVDDRRTEADAINMRAVLRYSLGNLDDARQLYEEALALRQTIHDAPGEGQITSNLGVLHRTLGDSRRAIEYYNEALVIRRRLGAVQPLANTLHNLGVAHADLGEHERALDLFNEALDLWRQSGGRRGEAFALQQLGQSYAKMGDSKKALEYYALASPVWKIVGDKRGEAQTLLSAAALRTARREYAGAVENYSVALELAKSGGYKREIGLATLGRATIERLQGQLDLALADANDAHTGLADIGERREAGRALAEVGATHLAANRLMDADTATRNAIAVFEEVEDRAEEAGARSRLSRISEKRGDLTAARRQSIASLDLVESARASIGSEGLSLSLFASKRAFYDDAIGLFMRLHAANPSGDDDVQAFGISERMRARGLLDLLAAGEVRALGHDTTAIAEMQRVQELINGKAARLTRLLGPAAGKGTPAITTTRRELDELLARLDRFRADLRRRSSDLGELSLATPRSLADIQSAMDDGTVLLECAIGQEHSVAWVVTRTAHRTFAVPGRIELDRLTRAAREALSDSTDLLTGESMPARAARLEYSREAFDRSARALSSALLEPAAAELHQRPHLLLVLDGSLQAFPVGALWSPTRETPRRLADTHELVLLPSASVGDALKSRAAARTTHPTAISVFADPVFAADDARVQTANRSAAGAGSTTPLPRLRFSRTEADAIAKVAPRRVTVWSDFSANRRNALNPSLANTDVLHLATHAVVDEERPQLSAVVLSQVDAHGKPQDGLIRLHEVYELPLNARLVVLSACRTALGRQVESEGLIGLARAFLHAGADAVLATLWDVDDRATAAFMTRFYDGLITRKLSPAAALRSAQQAQRLDARWTDPRDWAGFVLIGFSE